MNTLIKLAVLAFVIMTSGCAVQPRITPQYGYGYSIDPWAMQPARAIVCPHGSDSIVSVTGQVVGCGPVRIMGTVPHGAVQPGYIQPQYGRMSTPPQAMAPQTDDIRPDIAQAMLDEMNRTQSNPCNSFWRTTIGATLGAIAGSLIGGDRVAITIGAIIGGIGGNANASMTCQQWTNTKMYLTRIVSQDGCRGQTRSTNGVVTNDEACNYSRSYMAAQPAPQFGRQPTQNVQRPASMRPYDPRFESTQPVQEK